MSTKTSIKRIALVAVATLGIGMVSTVSASAARVSSTLTVDGITVTTPSQTVNVGAVASSTFGMSFTADGDGTLFGSVDVSISVPTGSAITVGDKTGATGGVIANNTGTTGTTTVPTNSAAGDHVKFIPAAGALATATPLAGTLSFTPDAPGTYVVTLTGNTLGTPATANAVTATMTVVVRSLSYTTGDGAAASPYSTGNGVAGVANTVTVTAQTTKVASQKALVTVSGAGATIQSASNSTVSADFLSTVVNAAAASSIVIKTPTTGTVTVSLFNETSAGSGLYSTTASNTVTITVNAAASSGLFSYATAFVSATQGSAPTATDSAISASSSAAARARIAVRQYDNSDTLLVQAQTKAITVSISGVGQLGTSSAATGNYVAVAAAAGTNSGPNDFYVWSDGRSGVGTVTIAVNGVTVATKAITFYGSVASYTLTVKNKAIRVGDSADTQVLTVAALDANGVAVPSATVYVSSGSTSYATVDSATVITASDGTAADIGINGVAKGSSVITVGNASSSATVSATATISVVTAGIASVALSFDKDEYAPGELVTVTVSAKNSDGVAAGDATYANLLTSAGLVGSVVLQGYAASASVALTDGAKSYTFYAPLIEGTVVVKGTLDTSVDSDYQGLVVSKSFNVVAANGGTSAAIDAANEATDAANAATDAANAAAEAADAATAAAQDAQAAVAALATQVASLIAGIKAQITTLTNLVIKIQKKVKA